MVVTVSSYRYWEAEDEFTLTFAKTRSAQRARNAAASARQVFDTAELLEMILLELGQSDMQTLLLSKRVSKSFKAIMESSIKLQRALFLRRDTTHIANDDLSSARINPLLDVDSPQCLPFHFLSGDIYIETMPHTAVGVEERGAEVVNIKCIDAVLDSNYLPPSDMILLEKRQGQTIPLRTFICCFRLAHIDSFPNVIPMLDADHITVGELLEQVRKALTERYPEHYSKD